MNAMTMDLTWAPPAGEYNAASDLVDRTVAAGFANKAAFIDPTRQITYRELQQRCNRFANGLRRLGIRREERIALITLDTVDMPVIFWGAIKAGIVPIPINTLLLPMEGDPTAAGAFWQLAISSQGSFITPSRDWP